MKNTLIIRAIEAAQTRALRSAILRPNRPPEDSIYPSDDARDALHLGTFDGDKIVGIASIYRESWPLDANFKAYRLRGMAVDPAFQRRGIGAALVREALGHIKAQGGEVLWCNAREIALDFYRALGFESVGNEFEIPGIGPHFLMRRSVS